MRDQFQNWYADKVTTSLEEGKDIAQNAATVDLCTATIKPVQAQWVMRVYDIIRNEKDIIMQDFTKMGI